jgi:hypothetical protein
MDDVKIPGEPVPTGSPMVRTLTILASGLTAASLIVNLILQIVHFMKKRPIQPNQRDKVQAAALTLRVLRQMPGLVKQVRLFVSQIRAAS